MIVTERVVRWAMTSLTMLLLCAAPTIGVPGERYRGTPGGQPHRERAPLALVGYVSPSEAAPRWLGLGGAWSATRGWITPPGYPEQHFPAAWGATSWQLFSDPQAGGRTIRTRPVPQWGESGSFYRMAAPAPAGVAVTGAIRPRPRLARAEQPDRRELRASTRNLLAQYGILVPARPRILEAYRVDLNGDGREEVLWTARSRDGWVSPIPNTPGGPRPGDYALPGLRFLTSHGVRSVALALAAAGDDCFNYRLFSPVDLNADGRMEIVAHAQGFEDDSLLVFTFDGRRVAGVLGTHLPDDQPMARARGSRPGSPVPPIALSQRPRTGSAAAANAERVKTVRAVEHATPISSALGDIANDGEPDEIAVIGTKEGRYSPVPPARGSCRPPSRAPAARQRIVFARGVDKRDGGDLWMVGVDGRNAQRLTTGETFHDLAVDRDRIACLRWGKAPTMDTNLYVLSPPGWRPRRVTMGGAFGMACWIPGTEQLFIGRDTDDPACDEGLYQVDARRRTRRRLLAPIHDELTVAGMIRLSPRGHYLAAGSVITGCLGYVVLDLRSRKRIPPRPQDGLAGGRQFAWLDDQNLLLASTSNAPEEEKPVGGIFRLNLRTRCLTRWLYSAEAEVAQLCRSPQGDRFAVGLDEVDTPALLPFMAARVELVDRRTKARHALKLPGPAHLCGFSPDGTRLLLLVLSRTEPPTKDDMYRGMKSDAYVFDLRTGACHRVARNAFDAAWMEEAQGGAAGLPNPASTATGRKVYPVDEGVRDRSFAAFRRKLITAARGHDRRFIYSIVAPNVEWDLGERRGRRDLIKEWNSQPPGELERELVAVLSLGGQLERRSGFGPPYTATRLRKVSVEIGDVVILGKNIHVRAHPNSTARVVGVLSYDAVNEGFIRSVPSDSVHPTWVRITTPASKGGYVPGRCVRGAADYEASFEKRRGRWWMTGFTSGE
jgi:hypothetical protein